MVRACSSTGEKEKDVKSSIKYKEARIQKPDGQIIHYDSLEPTTPNQKK